MKPSASLLVLLALTSALSLLASACATATPGPSSPEVSTRPASLTRHEQVGNVHEPTAAPTSWKERMAVPYVYMERMGDYRDLGATMRVFLQQFDADGLQAAGAPFALFYDDPGRIPTENLRARVCLPVTAVPASSSLRFEVLPRAMVAYSRVAGPYPSVPAMYPTLLTYMERLGWSPDGPIREVYLVNPEQATSYEELVTEVQIPWSPAR